MASLDVLVPTCARPAALAVTLATLVSQSYQDFRVVVSDQGERQPAADAGEVKAVVRLLEHHGHEPLVVSHLPRRGVAENRQFLLDQATAPLLLFLDDDLLLEPWVIERMTGAIEEEGCGFVGSAVIGLSYGGDVRPNEQAIEFWEGRVTPETVLPGTPGWERHRLHNAANLLHVAERMGLDPRRPRKYRVAWVGGCVLYDARALRGVGGFEFWRDLPVDHAGEDVLAQLRVMARYGGCGLIPSGVYHQELPTTLTDRRYDAPQRLPIVAGTSESED
ncbi:MAG TPA: glycosyltransferase [Vicinamibacterales bacterium]|nr:glycosyltransferase [Vicinamibacterales bacterium]